MLMSGRKLTACPVFAAILLLGTSALAQPSSAIGTRVDMGDFLIDVTEVTIGQYAAHAARHNIRTAAEREGGGFEYTAGWQRRPGWTFRNPVGQPGAADLPAAHVSWFEAQAYCEDAGGSLPTRTQWVLAAYTEQRINPPKPFVRGRTYPYPTGDSPDGANNNGNDPWLKHAPAGRTIAGVNGLYEMGGNVWEWLADAQGDERLTAGGSLWYGPAKMTIEGMQYKPAQFYAVYVGFRCVYPAQR